jgi:hypothetical protein
VTSVPDDVIKESTMINNISATRPRRQAAINNWKSAVPVKFRDFTPLSAQFSAATAYKMSLNRALLQKDKYDSTINAIYNEIKSMMNENVMDMLSYNDIPQQYKKSIIPVHMFLKDKFKANGSFDKSKARMVMNGNLQNVEQVGDTTSPTVNPISVMTQLNIAATQTASVIGAFDVKTAFLKTPTRKDKPIYTCIPKDIVKHWITLYPKLQKYVNKNGNIYAKLNKYLYGLQESSKEFNHFIDKHLKEMNFRTNKADKCLYMKDTEDGLITLSIHVDDMLVVAPNKSQLTKFENEISKHVELVCQYHNVSYLGMLINRQQNGDIKVTQQGFIKDILKKCNYEHLSKPPSTPASSTLTDIDDSSPKLKDKSKFQSLIMSLMYLARFTRPDILMPVSYLSTRSNDPTEEDYQKLLRVVRYLSGTKSVGIVFKHNIPISPKVYADASHGLHTTGHGQGGIAITLGSGTIYCRSFKIKSITRSSSESELFTVEDASTFVVWLKTLLLDLGIDILDPIPVFQDNKSTIIMAIQGGNFKRTKHLICKESYVRERLLAGDMRLLYLPTSQMPADMLTKPMSKVLLLRFMSYLYIL